MSCQPSAIDPAFIYHSPSGDQVIYAQVTPKRPSIKIPYWCSNRAAYDNAAPTGLISLSDPQISQNLPVAAKQFGGTIAADIKACKLKPLQDYGTVFRVGKKVIKFDPQQMSAQVHVTSLKEFISKHVPVAAATPNVTNPPSSTAPSSALKPSSNTGLLLLVGGLFAIMALK